MEERFIFIDEPPFVSRVKAIEIIRETFNLIAKGIFAYKETKDTVNELAEYLDSLQENERKFALLTLVKLIDELTILCTQFSGNYSILMLAARANAFGFAVYWMDRLKQEIEKEKKNNSQPEVM